jgi:hypothetical protein
LLHEFHTTSTGIMQGLIARVNARNGRLGGEVAAGLAVVEGVFVRTADSVLRGREESPGEDRWS